MSALLAALRRHLATGRAVRGGDPHPYAVDRGFPAGCWCGQPACAPVHARSRDEVQVAR